jgi:hypothetical protein
MISLQKIICTAGTFTVGEQPIFVAKENPEVAAEYRYKEILDLGLFDPLEILEENEELDESIVAFVYLDFGEEDPVLLPVFYDTGFSVKT